MYDKIIKKINEDPSNPKAYRDCPACKHNIVRQVEIGAEMILFNACVKCNHKWADIMKI